MLWQDYTLISAFGIPVVIEMAWIGYHSGHHHDLLSTAFVANLQPKLSLPVTSLLMLAFSEPIEWNNIITSLGY
jgi:hypothetical protein